MHERTRRPRREDEPEVERPQAAPDASAQRLLALQRGAGNAAVARLIERDGTLHAPAGWLDAMTRDGDAQTSIRDMYTRRRTPLLEGLRSSLPLPGLNVIDETTPEQIRTKLLYDLKPTVGKSDGAKSGRFVGEARRILNSHTDLLEISDSPDPLAPPSPRKIMRPLDLMPEPSDLAEASEDQLRVMWCGLIALIKHDGKAAMVDFLNARASEGWRYGRALPRASSANIELYRAAHAYFYTHLHLEYDDTSSRMPLMSPFGFTLKFVGPTSFDQLWKLNLKAGEKYIFDIHRPGHTMLTKIRRDFTTPLTGEERLSDVFEFDNDTTNYNLAAHETLRAHVINIWKKG